MRQTQKRRRGGNQLVLRDKGMSVSKVIGQLEQDARLYAALVVRVYVQLQCKRVHH